MSEGPTVIDSLEDVPEGKEAYCPYCESTNIRRFGALPIYICDDCESSGLRFRLRPTPPESGGESDG